MALVLNISPFPPFQVSLAGGKCHSELDWSLDKVLGSGVYGVLLAV